MNLWWEWNLFCIEWHRTGRRRSTYRFLKRKTIFRRSRSASNQSHHGGGHDKGNQWRKSTSVHIEPGKDYWGEKSNTRWQNKRWILIKSENWQHVNQFLNSEVGQHMEHVMGKQHMYNLPYAAEQHVPSGIQLLLGTYASALQKNQIRTENKQPWKPVTEKSTVGRRTEVRLQSTPRWKREEIPQLEEGSSLRKAAQTAWTQKMLITEQMTESSILTNLVEQQKKLQEEYYPKGMQMENLLNQLT